MRRPHRELTEDELTLWRHVTRNVKAHAGVRRVDPAPQTARHPSPDLDQLRVAPASPRPRASSSPGPLVAGVTAGIDRRTARRFTRGQMSIDARLDLHGLTVAEAHTAVGRFIRRAAAAGHRCVLIVTGKGGPEKPGRIRGESAYWLSEASLRPLILAIQPARPEHGGGGALYVLLKRQRR